MGRGMRKAVACVAAWCAAGSVLPASTPDDEATVRIPGGRFETLLPPTSGVRTVDVAPFELDRTPVTNAQFARFVAVHPEWRRDRAPRLFTDEMYLSHWRDATTPATATGEQPVTRVSWFAANAYCESRGRRLPTWHEWELASAAGTRTRDARHDPAWRQGILDWYARPASAALPDVGRNLPNYYGVRDLHGLVWEWVLDAGSMMVSGDNRERAGSDVLRFCGTGALELEQKENYAMLMRVATLSSMRANYSSSSMGFRCAADVRSP
jgi:formylglycine-generating enzyme